MAELVSIGQSVGAGGSNDPIDVGKITTALLTIGPARGGLSSVPMFPGALAEAIRQFQTFQKLPVRDGRVDKSGNTIRRINELLNSGVLPTPPSPVIRTGNMKYMDEMIDGFDRNVYAPIETSLTTDWVFKWTEVSGSGLVHFFELDEDVVPNWFGLVVPNGVTNFEHIHIFFHPTPSNRGIDDRDYKTKAEHRKIFHYLTDDMAVQFCAANTGQVLVMPLLTNGAMETCGIFPQRWESIVGQMLGQLASPDMSPSSPPKTISSVVISSFSNGITYSAAFRKRAVLGERLRGVIDFDGIISTFSQKSQSLPPTSLKFWQSGIWGKNVMALSAANSFPLPYERWQEPPYKGQFKGNFRDIMYGIHGSIPQKMMHFAARRTAPR